MNQDTTKQWKSVLLFSAGVCAVCALGMVESNSLVKSALPAPPPVSLSAVAPPKPIGISVGFSWSYATNKLVSAYRVYTATNRINPVWKLALELPRTNSCVVSNVTPPMWFAARSVSDAGESTNSNIAGVLGWDAVLTVWSEVSSNAAGGFRYLAPVVTQTNPVGQEFFRVGASVTNRLRIE